MLFEEMSSAGSVFHVAEAKGFSMHSYYGQQAITDGLGGITWSRRALQKASSQENLDARLLLGNANNRYYTSFRDGIHVW